MLRNVVFPPFFVKKGGLLMPSIFKPFSNSNSDWSYTGAAAVTNTADVLLSAAPTDTGRKNYLIGIQLKNTSATATEVVIKDGSTVIWRSYLPASMITADNVTFYCPLRTAGATVLNFACITTGANVYVNAQGYKAH